MHLAWLEDFQSLAETGNFSRSAALRHTTQSAFSRRIRALENWVGAELIDRSTYPVKLTEAGRLFLGTVDEVCRNLKDGRARAAGAGRHVENAIVIAATHMVAFNFFPAWLEALEQQLGPLHKRLQCHTVEKCFNELQNNRTHFVLCPLPDAPLTRESAWEQFPYIIVGRDTLVPVSRPDANGAPLHALPGTRKHPVPLLAVAEGSLLGGAIRRLLTERAEAAHFDIVFESPLKEAVKAMAKQGQGLAWLPRSVIEPELSRGLLTVAGGEEWNTSFDIRCYRTSSTLPPDGQRLWNLLEEHTAHGC